MGKEDVICSSLCSPYLGRGHSTVDESACICSPYLGRGHSSVDKSILGKGFKSFHNIGEIINHVLYMQKES